LGQFSLRSNCPKHRRYTWSGGYKDTDLGEGKYLVEYFGNGTVSRATVEAFWERRANEVCPKGFDLVRDEKGKNDGGIFVSPAVTIDHPWKKAVIKCNE